MIDFVLANSTYLVTGNYTPPVNGTASFWATRTGNIGQERQGIFGSGVGFKVKWGDTGQSVNKIMAGTLRRRNKPTRSNTVFDVLNARHYIAITWAYTASNTTVEIYVDGILDISDAQADYLAPAAPLYIGALDGPRKYADANLEDLRFYNRILSAGEIQTIHNCRGTDGIRYGLTNRWMMNDGSGTASGADSVIDSVGGLHATPTNSPTYSGSELKFRRVV